MLQLHVFIYSFIHSFIHMAEMAFHRIHPRLLEWMLIYSSYLYDYLYSHHFWGWAFKT